MKKRRQHRISAGFRRIHPIFFLTLALISGVVCVFGLRANNQHMIKLRDAVYAADKDNTDIQTPLKSLQAYVTTHMNTTLSDAKTGIYPPIQLKYTYDRLVQAHSAQVAESNSTIYNQAQAYCEGQNSTDFSGRNRVPCIEQYVQSHNGQALTTIPDALYKFAFVTPVWSPDLAGWSMLAAALSGLLFIVSLAARKFSRK